jgi:hypothetical protein
MATFQEIKAKAKKTVYLPSDPLARFLLKAIDALPEDAQEPPPPKAIDPIEARRLMRAALRSGPNPTGRP